MSTDVIMETVFTQVCEVLHSTWKRYLSHDVYTWKFCVSDMKTKAQIFQVSSCKQGLTHNYAYNSYSMFVHSVAHIDQ